MQQINVYAEMFKLFKLSYLKTGQIPLTNVSKIVFTKYYQRSISAGLTPIENLTQEEKDELVKEAGQSRIKCTILYLIKVL